VQILGDQHGNLVHLFERDCSVQRRYQKIIEIAPAPTLREETRNKLYEYATRLTRFVNYNNAGTVEFLVDKKENIFFIEVNPRIQVEHTVTEEITGIDIVRSQLLIAMGHYLSDPEIGIESQEKIKMQGAAIQCRITTEDPADNFKPDFGTIVAYRNAAGFGVRQDEGSIYSGVKVSPFFDSMLVKLTVKGNTLSDCCERMHRVLQEFRIRGVKTNIPFLENVINHPVFRRGKATVDFIDNHPELFEFERKQDRGTKLLSYLAEVIVNGHPDVEKKPDVKLFETADIPHFDSNKNYTPGTKDLLNQLGREKFCEWTKKQKQILFTDTTFRDAHQSLLATRMRTLDMLNVAESFAKNNPQTFSMEVWGGATFDVALRFLHEDPWERLQQFREAVPNILLQMLFRGSNAVGYAAYPDNLIEKFIERSWKNGIDIFRIFDSLNWLEAMKVSIRTVRERTEALAEACICYTGDILDPARKKYTLQYYLDLAKQLEDQGAHLLCIKDMAGLLKPYAAKVLIKELKKHIDIPIHLHTHDTSGNQMAMYSMAVESGVDIIDVAISSLSGMTSQPSFNSAVELFKDSPRKTNFNTGKLSEFSDYWEKVRKYYQPFESGMNSSAADVYLHEMPGGQYTNLQAQANALGLSDRWDEIKRKYREVNDIMGDIVKVTPSSKVVGDFTLFMITNDLSEKDIFEKGETLSFPDSVISFFRGDLGQMPGGFPKRLQKIILKKEKPYTNRPNAHLKPIDFEKEFSEFKKQYDVHCTMDDFLSYKMYPKVWDEYFRFQRAMSDVWYIPTPAFFYGLKPNEEILVSIGEGKTVLVRFLNMTTTDENGIRTVFFRLNGQTRGIDVKDRTVKTIKAQHKKASGEKEIGAPLQGVLRKISVKTGDTVKMNQPLFTMEAMKMESTIVAPKNGKVKSVILKENTFVEAGDAIVEFE
jgi:pyruvate carboxylase